MEIENVQDMLSKSVSDITTQMNDQKDKFILDIFKENGYEFKTKAHLEHFIKTACRIERFDNKLISLYVDDILLTQWWDNYEIETDFEGTTHKVTMIYGCMPKELI